LCNSLNLVSYALCYCHIVPVIQNTPLAFTKGVNMRCERIEGLHQQSLIKQEHSYQRHGMENVLEKNYVYSEVALII
jgi:hypothetical protein